MMNYYSVTKFVNKLNEHIENLQESSDYNLDGKFIDIYFEGSEVGKNQYGITVKPIYIRINFLQPQFIKYDKIIEYFGSQPILSFKESRFFI